MMHLVLVNLENTCKALLNYLCSDKELDISIAKDYSLIISMKRESVKKNSFAIQFPHLLEEWDYEKKFCSFNMYNNAII